MKAYKRIVALFMTMICLLGCFSGCGRKDADAAVLEVTPAYSTSAMGRYVQAQIPIPEGEYPLDMVMLDDGRLRIALASGESSAIICTMDTGSQAWEVQEIPADIRSSGRVGALALSPDGTVFCHTVQEADAQGNYSLHFWVMDPEGALREIPITFEGLDTAKGYLVPFCDFTDSGKLMVQFYFEDLRQVDLTTGELGGNVNELERMILFMRCAGEDAYMLGHESASVHAGGETAALDNALGQQLTAVLKATAGTTPRFTFWQNRDGYLFYTTHEGLFSYIPGGSITEELVSGSRSTLGDPSFFPIALTGAEDDTFYVLGNCGEENLLLHFTYDAQTPTAADTKLKIYSLYQDEDMPQMISQYQVAHPEVEVELEIGVTGEDGITQADAIRTLNTEILAGNGPDLICLDGFNLKSYFEKGMLLDLNEVLDRAEPTLTQITKCYEENGVVYAVPTSFQIPVMYGPEHIVSQIHDWDSLIAATAQLSAEKPDAFGVLGAFQPVDTADQFYDTYSGAWLQADGTISEEKLTEYYARMQQVWALDSKLQTVWADRIEEPLSFEPGQYIGLMSSISMIDDQYCIGFGTLNGMYAWSVNLAADSELDNYVTAPLELHGSGTFIPKGVMGILSTSQHPQAAGEFLKFMLSEETQAKDLAYSFPVNQAAFDKELSEDREPTGWLSSSDRDGNDYSFQTLWPSKENRDKLRSWVEKLSTPASQDRIIRNMVMDQMHDCMLGKLTPEEAAQTALRTLNLYLSE